MKKLFEVQWPGSCGKNYFNSEKLLDYILSPEHIPDPYVIVHVRDINDTSEEELKRLLEKKCVFSEHEEIQ